MLLLCCVFMKQVTPTTSYILFFFQLHGGLPTLFLVYTATYCRVSFISFVSILWYMMYSAFEPRATIWGGFSLSVLLLWIRFTGIDMRQNAPFHKFKCIKKQTKKHLKIAYLQYVTLWVSVITSLQCHRIIKCIILWVINQVSVSPLETLEF